MGIVSTAVVILAAAWVGFSAVATYTRQGWVVDNLADYGVPRSWWPWLATAKLLGALGLLVGLVVPPIGVLAAGGLVVYFLGAIVTVVRAGAYAHLPFPLLYLTPAAVAGTLIGTA